MKAKKYLSILLFLPVILILSGFGFSNVSVKVDTEKNRVYEYVSVDELLSDFAKNANSAEDKYKGGYYILTGKIDSVSEKGDRIDIVGFSSADNSLICSLPRELRSEALTYKVDDSIGVFGKVTVDFLDKEIRIKPDKLGSIPTAIKKGSFYLLDGTHIDKNDMTKRTMNNGTISFSIPSAWKEIEIPIVENGLGTIEGYQYVLNKLPGNTDTVPESFFICYFDNASKLENTDDKKETALIEKAIINNISGDGKGDSARTKDVYTYYGPKYNYYIGSYTDALDMGNNGYHVEYIFQKNGNDGLVMYLYLYKDAKHLKDIMFVTRFLEIKAN